jgi:hypothetical protein
MKNNICIYHGNCADGFGAAWVVRRFAKACSFFDDLEFYPAVYQKEPPDVKGRHIIMVDFSYKLEPMKKILVDCKSITIIDHHKTALEVLEALGLWQQGNPELHGKMVVHFDLKRSGAGLAWDVMFPDKPRPALIERIEDRDLGGGIAFPAKFNDTRCVNTVIFSYPYDFDIWDQLMLSYDTPTGHDIINLEGEVIDRKHFKDINELIKVLQRDLTIGGYVVPVMSLPYIWSSDAGFIMSEGKPFAACYFDTPSGRVFSLRSRPEGQDVSSIAKLYGGGGHARAAGFEVPRDHPLAQA